MPDKITTCLRIACKATARVASSRMAKHVLLAATAPFVSAGWAFCLVAGAKSKNSRLTKKVFLLSVAVAMMQVFALYHICTNVYDISFGADSIVFLSMSSLLFGSTAGAILASVYDVLEDISDRISKGIPKVAHYVREQYDEAITNL